MTTSTLTSPAQSTATSPSERLIGVATIVGPLLMLGSTVAWLADADEARSILIMWAMIGFGLTLVGFSGRLRTDAPGGSAAVLGLGMMGTCAGAAYAAEAAIVEHFAIERLNEQTTMSATLVLQVPGLTFPLSIIAAAVLSWRSGLLRPGHAAALAAGAAAFPASRVPEVAEIALLGDALLCAALVPIGLAVLRGAHPASGSAPTP
jgi:hypothetical protein